MPYRTIKVEESDYRYIEKSAVSFGISVHDMLSKILEKQRIIDKKLHDIPEIEYKKKSRWVAISERIKKDPPLRGAGDYVKESSREFRENFSFKHDTE